MFATVYHSYHIYACNAQCWHKCPCTSVSVGVHRKVSLKEFMSFTAILTCYIIKSTVNTSAFRMTYWSMITVTTDIESSIIQLSSLMKAEKSSNIKSLQRNVTCDATNYYDHSALSVNLSNNSYWIHNTYWVKYYFYKSIEPNPQ